MHIKVSKKGYRIKPSADDMKEITWSIKNNNHVKVDLYSLKKYIEAGYSVLLAEFNELGNIQENNIKKIELIALDIDSKENKITMFEMIELVKNKFGIEPALYYTTFSDLDNTKFRLIYKFQAPVNAEVYKLFYKSLVWKLEKYLDSQTVNANRIWAGTNKEVFLNEKTIPIPFKLLIKLINSYNSKLSREKNKNKKVNKNFSGESVKLKAEMKFNVNRIDELVNYLIDNVDLKDYIQKHFGGTFKRNSDLYTGRCVLHGGDNPSALVIYEKSYRCYTCCGSGNIITLAKKVYNTDSFFIATEQLIKELNLSIPVEFMG